MFYNISTLIFLKSEWMGINMGVISKSWRYYKGYKPIFGIMYLIMVLQITMAVLLPQITQLIIDRIINPALGAEVFYSDSNIFSGFLNGFAVDDYFGMLTVMAILLVANRLLLYIFHYTRWNMMHHYMMLGLKKMRNDVFDVMLRTSPLTINRYSAGNLLNINNNDPATVKEMYLMYIPAITENFLYIILGVFMLFRISPYLMIAPFVCGSITSVVVIFYNKALKKRFDKIREGNADLNSCLQENINGVRIIRSFASEKIETDKFEKRNAAFRDNYVDLSKTTAKYSAIFRFVGESMGLTCTIVGLLLALNGNLSVGEFATFSAYAAIINNCIVGLAVHFGNIQNSMVAGRRYFEFLEEKDLVPEDENPLSISKTPNIQFKNVCMSFDGKPVLKDISFDLPYGKKLGIMGATGSGKTVVLKLLSRLYDCDGGKIEIDGNDIRKIATEDVRNNVSYVMQDVFLFSDTVRNNIAFYGDEINESDVVRAAEISESTKIIPKLSDGYETVIGERGLGLSGGQKQRLSIARAIYKNAQVFLLDDCTSALDYETELQINENFSSALSDRSVITVSHRASAVKECDEILYMDNGVIVERGNHTQLMSLDGMYAKMYLSQESMREEEVA